MTWQWKANSRIQPREGRADFKCYFVKQSENFSVYGPSGILNFYVM